MSCGTVPVSFPQAEAFPGDSWVKVKSIVAQQPWKLQATSVTTIPQPSSPDVHPSNGFLKADLNAEED